MYNKTFYSIICCIFCLLTITACGKGAEDTPPKPDPDPTPNPGGGTQTNYYISSSLGSDNNAGTSPSSPWKTIGRINNGTFEPGDSILLKSGDLWTGVSVINSKFTGTEEAPIVMSSYGRGERPRLSATTPPGAVILTINNSDYFHIEKLNIGDGPGYGLVMGINDDREHGNIVMKNIHTHDMPLAGMFFNATANKNVSVTSCTSENTEMLFAVSGGKNINISDCTAEDCIYGGFSIIGVNGGSIDRCKVLHCGTGNYPNGACGIFLGVNDGFLITNTEVAHQKRQNDNPDGEAIDFERDNKNVVVRDCYMHNNAGCAMMFFDNMKGSEYANENCVVENCRFENNSRNCLSPSGFEIYFTRPDNNNNGIIRNNTFTLAEDVGFITTTDLSVTISGNKKADGTLLELAPAYNGTPALLNAGFEQPGLGNGFKAHPSGASWTFRENSGIAGNGSAFDPPHAPQGTQVLFLQGKSNVSQWISLAAGNYKMIYSAAFRASSKAGQGVELYVDNEKVGDAVYPDSGTDFTQYESATFTAKAGIRLIELRGIYDGDKTAFIDKISIVAVQ